MTPSHTTRIPVGPPNGCGPLDRVECRAQFARVLAALDRIDEAIRGNALGEKPGILLRLDRLETAATTRARLLWLIAASTVAAAVGTVWKLIASA